MAESAFLSVQWCLVTMQGCIVNKGSYRNGERLYRRYAKRRRSLRTGLSDSLWLLTSKKWQLQREGRQSRRPSIETKSDWLFDKPRPYHWLRVNAINLASQSACLAAVTQSHCNPQWDFLRFLGRLLWPEEGMERVLGQTCDFSRDQQTSSDFLRSWCACQCAELHEKTV